MKTYYKIIILAFIGLVFTHCSNDFLDTMPISDLSTENYFQTAEDAENLLTGCYNNMGDIWNPSVIFMATSDNNYAGGDNPDGFRLDNFERITNGENVTETWNSLYPGINRCNTVLKYVPQIDDPKLDEGGRREIILGEAAFLRAYNYFRLVRLWGDVPLRTSPTETIDPDSINLFRSPVEEVYTQIIKDLEYSASVLPKADNPAQLAGRATQGAAYALLAQVYAAKIPVDWEKVKQYCDEVISSNIYELVPDYDYLFDGAHENSSESIFEIQFEKPNFSQWSYQLMAPPSVTGDSWRKFNTPSQDLIKAFIDEGDSIRYHSSILWEDVTGYWVDPVYGTRIPFPFKWRHPGGWSSDDNFCVIRLAETILLRAEARNELNDIDGALSDMKTVRDRVNLPAKNLSDKDAVRDAILLERRLELAFEFYRWYDLLRTGRAITTMQNLGYSAQAPRDLLFPIPQDARDRNPNLTQNPGYE